MMQGDAIQATIREIDYNFVAQRIETTCVYDISYFYTAKSKPSFQVVPHVASLIFNARRTFKKLLNVQPTIPTHCFYFLGYNHISSWINDNSILKCILIQLVFLNDVLST